MKTTLLVLGAALIIFSAFAYFRKGKAVTVASTDTSKAPSIYDQKFSLKSLDGKSDIDLSSFKGKKLLIVNVASECGYTPQYEDLQKLYTQYGNKLNIIGFPCNQFGGQEPGSPDEIATFCKKNYGVTFPLTEKVEVKDTNQHPVYAWLTHKSKNGVDDFEVKWNFNKFLLDENGKLLGYYSSKIKPFDEQIVSFLK